VVGVHISVPEKASTTPRNHVRLDHSTLSRTGSKSHE
jgi:hypothetical protein